MIEFATQAATPALQSMWTTCFGDDKAYVAFLFERLLKPERILVDADKQGNPLSMLCLQPFVLAGAQGSAQGAYIFGVATLPEERGKGKSTALLKACHRRLRSVGFALSALVPATESLFGFYENCGYETQFHIIKATYLPEEIPPARRPCALVPGALEALADVRDRIYQTQSRFVRWSRDYLAYIGEECKMLGGEVLRIACGGEMGYAVCYRVGDEIRIKELALRGEYMADAMAALHARYRAARYVVSLPANSPEMANKVLPFAMVRWYDRNMRERFGDLSDNGAWIAHVLDE